MELIAAESWYTATEEERARACNGCGPAGWRVDIVPDTILGLDITPACNRHDWRYSEGGDKTRADIEFLANMVLLCAKGSKWLLPLRLHRCCIYFLAVYLAGDKSFKGVSA